jgi:hypothetical protein
VNEIAKSPWSTFIIFQAELVAPNKLYSAKPIVPEVFIVVSEQGSERERCVGRDLVSEQCGAVVGDVLVGDGDRRLQSPQVV